MLARFRVRSVCSQNGIHVDQATTVCIEIDTFNGETSGSERGLFKPCAAPREARISTRVQWRGRKRVGRRSRYRVNASALGRKDRDASSAARGIRARRRDVLGDVE